MQEAELQQTLQLLQKYNPRTLLKIWWKQKTKAWSPEDLEVMRRVLIDSKELLLPPEPDRGVTVRVQFDMKRVKPIDKAGQYRGRGAVYADETGIALSGKHVYSTARRWGVALAVFAGCAVLTKGFLAPGLIPLYLLVEFGILKKENLWIPYSQICRYAANPKKKLVAIEFNGPGFCSPAVFESDDWRTILWTLRNYTPQCDAKPEVQL